MASKGTRSSPFIWQTLTWQETQDVHVSVVSSYPNRHCLSALDMTETPRHKPSTVPHSSSLIATRKQALDILILHLPLLRLLLLLHHLSRKRRGRRIVDLVLDILGRLDFRSTLLFRFYSLFIPLFALLTA
jgi:hypothetical protein